MNTPPTVGIEVTTKAQAVADKITAAIAVGAYTPGDRLPPERELAASLNVSRVTVREAIRTLTDVGMLIPRRGAGGGTFVADAPWQMVAREGTVRSLEAELPRLRDFNDYRCLIAATITRTAAERCTAQDAVRLRELLEEFDQAPTLAAARGADQRLHAEIDRITRNERLVQLSVQLTTEATLGLNSEPYPAHYLSRAGHDHHRIVEAVIANDADAAFNVARDHFGLTLEIFEDGLQRARAAQQRAE